MRISKVLIALVSAGTIFGMGLQSANAAEGAATPGATGAVLMQGCAVATDAFVSLQAAPEIGIGSKVPVGAGYLRLWDENVAWRNLFPTSNTPDPTAMKVLSDRLDQAHNSGSKALYVLGLTPLWAAADPSAGDARFGAGSASPPSNPDYFDNYVRTLVNTFGSKIDAYELWNEGNIRTFWWGTPEQLADLTARAYTIIKAADPSAIVLAPSTTLRLSNAMNTFVSGFFAQAAKTSPAYAFDGFAIHSYPSGTGTPMDRQGLIIKWQTAVAIALHDNYALLSRPIWDTEVNYGLAGPSATPATDYTDAQGADFLKQTYADSKALGIDATFWYLYTAEPFDLLGVQFNSGTPLTTAAWNETRAKWAPGGACPGSISAAGSAGSSSGNTGGSSIATHFGPIVTVGSLTLPPSLEPGTGGSTTIIGNQPVTCSQSASDIAVTVGCGTAIVSSCATTPSATASFDQPLTSRSTPPGLYVQVTDGFIDLINQTPTLEGFTAGQFGYTPPLQQPPVILPSNPSIQFTPPQSFTPNTPIPGSSPAPACTTAARTGDLRVKAAPAFAQGNVALVQAGGFAPNTTVSAYLGKSTTASSLNTDAQGNISMWIRVPASTPIGATTVQVNGHLASKALVSVTSGVTVRAAAPHVVAGSVAMDANQKKLNAKEKTGLNKIAVQGPATVPSKCTITATAANGKSIKGYYAKSGLTCSVKKSSVATNATVNVQFAN